MTHTENINRQAYIEVTQQGPVVVEPSREFLEKNEQAMKNGDAAVAAVFRQALALYPGCSHAHWAMAGLEADRATALAHYERALDIQNTLWTEFAKKHEVRWGKDVGTHRFLGMAIGKGELLFKLGRNAEAMLCLRSVLDLDPDDHCGAKAAMLAEGEDMDDVVQTIEWTGGRSL